MTNARRLSIVVDEDAVIENRPVYTQIVSLAYESGLAGASVFRGIEGFGATRRVHTSRLLSVSENMPVLIVIIDTAEAIEQFLPKLGMLGVRGIVTMDDVEVVLPGALRERGQP
jgi:PII-like signaling protein